MNLEKVSQMSFDFLKDFTTEQLEGAVANALAAGDMLAVESLILVLYLKDAAAASRIVDAMKVGVAVRQVESDR